MPIRRRPATLLRRSNHDHEVHGIELHLRPTLSDYKICRIIHHGKVVTTTTTTPTAPPAVTVETSRTYREARDVAAAQVDRLLLVQSFRRAFETDLTFDPNGPYATTEAAFEAAWGYTIRVALGVGMGTERKFWALFRNLDQVADHSYGMAAARAYLQGAPHCTNTSGYQTVGLVGQLPQFPGFIQQSSLNGVALDVGVYLLGDRTSGCVHGDVACAPCEARIAELLEYLCRTRDLRGVPREQRTHLVHTARRLANATKRPVIPMTYSTSA